MISKDGDSRPLRAQSGCSPGRDGFILGRGSVEVVPVVSRLLHAGAEEHRLPKLWEDALQLGKVLRREEEQIAVRLRPHRRRARVARHQRPLAEKVIVL